MTPVETFLLALAAVLILGAVGDQVFALTNIPDALWLIAAGVVIGPVLGIAEPAELLAIAPYLGAVTIIVILFEGGSRLEIGTAIRSAPRATLLALLGFVVATLVVLLASVVAAAAGLLPQPWTWQHGLLLGTILGGSSSVVVMPVVLRARLDDRVSGLVSLESALTDVLCIVGASTMVELMSISATSAATDPAVAIARTFGFGVLGGLVAGACGLVALRFLRGGEYAYPMLLAGLLVLYAVVDANGGSAPLAILVAALIVANAQLPGVQGMTGPGAWSGSLGPTVRGLHGTITFVVKAFFFVFMGALLGPWSNLTVVGVMIGGLLLVARLIAVRVATAGAGLSAGERRLVAVLLPRGLAAGVLAGLPLYAGIPGAAPFQDVTFAAVLTTILIFAVAFPLVRRRPDEVTPAGEPPAARRLTSRMTLGARPPEETT